MTSRSGTGSGNITGTLRHIYSDKLSLEVGLLSIDYILRWYCFHRIDFDPIFFSFRYANSWERQC